MKGFSIIVFLNLLLALCNGQLNMTLPDCMEYAFDHNPYLNQFRYEMAKSAQIGRQFRLNRFPSLGLEYNHYINSGRSLNQENYEWENNELQQGNMALAVDMTIFQGFRNLHGQKSAQSTYEANYYALEEGRLQLGLEIIKFYYDIILAIKSIEILELTHHNTVNEWNSLQEQIAAGTMSKSSLYDLLAQSQKEILQIQTLQTVRDKSILGLMNLMNWPSDMNISLDTNLYAGDGRDILTPLFMPFSDIETALSNVPEIKEKELKMEALKYNIRMQKAQYFPVIRSVASVSSRYMRHAVDPEMQSENYDYISQVSDNQYKQLAVSVSAPLFDRNSRNTEIKLARIEYEKLQNEKLMARLELKNELLILKRETESLCESIRISREMVQACQKSYETATEKFRAGLLNACELNLAKNNYSGALLELSKIMIQYRMNLERMNMYIRY